MQTFEEVGKNGKGIVTLRFLKESEEDAPASFKSEHQIIVAEERVRYFVKNQMF
jgi:hypothetical protein